MKKVLIITYYWPPSGGAGVQRWLKFSKYLPEYGWEPIILTVDPAFAAFPLTDNSLEEGLPPEIRVFKTPAIDYFSLYKKDKSKLPSAGFANNAANSAGGKVSRFIRGNFFIPDPRRGWNVYAFRKACQLLECEKIEHVITTSPPHSTQLIGLKLKKKYADIKWTADLRDPWTDIYYYQQFYPIFIARTIDRWYEKRVLKNADKIITVGKSLKDLFSQKYAGISEKVEVITNGYDSDDFTSIISSSPEIFTISYIGTLSDKYPVTGIIEALRKFSEEGHKFNIRFTGTVSPSQKKEILSVPECSHAVFMNYAEHEEALRQMSGSSLLLLIIPEHRSNRSILTGKLFEYIASGKPILCIGPVDGDAAAILNGTGKGATFEYNDSTGMYDYLISIEGGKSLNGNTPPEKYSRLRLTEELGRLLEN